MSVKSHQSFRLISINLLGLQKRRYSNFDISFECVTCDIFRDISQVVFS